MLAVEDFLVDGEPSAVPDHAGAAGQPEARRSSGPNEARRAWLRVLAHADCSALRLALAPFADMPLRVLRAPEIGLVMARGRMGGVGKPFNLAEVTVTRCAVTDGSVVGHGYVLGRDKEKALLIARCDALLQIAETKPAVQRLVLGPLAAALEAARAKGRRRAAATRVDFFTLVRGDGW
jgi:alpha-D-ribose 1-methylphosphonate 5-triphosphate synthase subunit PhnG